MSIASESITSDLPVHDTGDEAGEGRTTGAEPEDIPNPDLGEESHVVGEILGKPVGDTAEDKYHMARETLHQVFDPYEWDVRDREHKPPMTALLNRAFFPKKSRQFKMTT